MASVTTPGNVEFITTPDRLEALCDTLVNEPFYAIDTEFHRERTYWPKLALLQFGWVDQVALVDPLAVDPVGLSRLFASDAVAVAHAAEQDLGILMSATGVVPATVFDTQIAAGFLGMSSPSLSRLVDALLGISLPKTDQLSDWLVRPLPASQLTYAASDVEHLLTLRSVMVSRLEQRGRLAWALEECARARQSTRTELILDQCWWKVGDVRRLSGQARGVAQAVAAWREERSMAVDRPRRSVLPDLAIITIAQRPPRNRNDLEKLRGVESRYLAKGAAEEILAAVERGRSLDPEALQLPPDVNDHRANQSAVAVCSGLVRQLAEENDLDQGLLANRAEIASLVLGEPSRLDDGWRREIAGDQLRRWLNGDATVAFEKGNRLVLEPRRS